MLVVTLTRLNQGMMHGLLEISLLLLTNFMVLGENRKRVIYRSRVSSNRSTARSCEVTIGGAGNRQIRPRARQ